MSDEFASTIGTLKSHLQKQEEEVRATKRLINQLCLRGGNQALYPDADNESSTSIGSLRRDQFYGHPLSTAIRKYLEMRRTLGPATVNDIYDALCAGGFTFEAKNDTNAKRSLYISLAKNSVTFHKLPGSTGDGAVFGLLEWYPNAKSEDDESKKGKKNKKKKGTPTPKPPVNAESKVTADKTEKGVPNEESKSAGSAARKKHDPAPIA